MTKQVRYQQVTSQGVARDRRPAPFLVYGLPILLAIIAALAYGPSLKSDFVYDGPVEIHEGFFTSLSNLPAVLTLKVLHMPLILGSRPGQLLFMMLIAAVCGTDPLGYHICSNLLHAANVALLFVFLRRLIPADLKVSATRISLALAAVTLLFALHPLAVEPVANVSYSSDLLATFFTLLSLLAATSFDPANTRRAWAIGIAGTLCAFAAVTCKESGLAAATLMIAYWLLFRRGETQRPWFIFLGAGAAVTAGFLAARFLLAPPSDNPGMLSYPGGSAVNLVFFQPRLWVFMMGKIAWPATLSADYRYEDFAGLSAGCALVILFAVLALQAWLATKSKMGAMGVAVYWLGLVTVSNLIPLYRPVGDRFYYLPMIGVAAQLLALLLLTAKSRDGFYVALVPCFLALFPLTLISVTRQDVFTSDLAMWTDTAKASPTSWTAHDNLGIFLTRAGRIDEAIVEYQKMLSLVPNETRARVSLADDFRTKGDLSDAIAQLRIVTSIKPDSPEAHNELGNALLAGDDLDDAQIEFHRAVELRPDFPAAYDGLATITAKQGHMDDAVGYLQTALNADPRNAVAHSDLGAMFAEQGKWDMAIAQFQIALQLDPTLAAAQENLARASDAKARGLPPPPKPGSGSTG